MDRLCKNCVQNNGNAVRKLRSGIHTLHSFATLKACTLLKVVNNQYVLHCFFRFSSTSKHTARWYRCDLLGRAFPHYPLILLLSPSYLNKSF